MEIKTHHQAAVADAPSSPIDWKKSVRSKKPSDMEKLIKHGKPQDMPVRANHPAACHRCGGSGKGRWKEMGKGEQLRKETEGLS